MLEEAREPAILRVSPAPLLRLRGRVGRRSRSSAQPWISLRLRRPERSAAERTPSSAQGRLPLLSLCPKAWEASSSKAVSALQSDGHARRSRRHGAGTRSAPAESRLHGVRRPLSRSQAQGCGYMSFGCRYADREAPSAQAHRPGHHQPGHPIGTGPRCRATRPWPTPPSATARQPRFERRISS